MNPVMNIAALVAIGASALGAQSLSPKHPALLQSGVNAANIDAFMTPHYWTFVAKKGNVKINVSFRAQSIIGAQLRTQIAFNIYNAAMPDKKFTKVLESMGREVTEVIEGPSEGVHQMVIEVVPPKAIVRAGGDYQIQAVQGVDFVGGTRSEASARVRDYQSQDRDPDQIPRLAVLDSAMIKIGQAVSNFTLADQNDSPVTRYPLPDFCLRLSNNFGQFQKRFGGNKSRDQFPFARRKRTRSSKQNVGELVERFCGLRTEGHRT